MGTHRQPAGNLQISFMFNLKRQHNKEPASLRSAELRKTFFPTIAQLHSQPTFPVHRNLRFSAKQFLISTKNITKLLRGHGNQAN